MTDRTDFDLIEDLPNDGTREKEVYARYGLAAYRAQVFDHGLVNLLAIAASIDEGASLAEIDNKFELLFAKTTGALVTTAAKESRLGAEDIALCRSAVAERNRLVHHFFREHAENFFTESGQQRIVDDADRVGELMGNADSACHRVLMRLGKDNGITEETIDVQFQQMKAQILDQQS